MAIDKMTLIGMEISEGVSKKTGRPYSMGSVFFLTELAPAFGDGITKGAMGDRLDCDTNVLRKIQHLPFPLTVEVERKDVMQFGERKTLVTDIRPVDVVKKVA